MTDTPYLILHKVRGEPAFDIAIKAIIGEEEGWIIPTSGHRAYPYWQEPLTNVIIDPSGGFYPDVTMLDESKEVPPDLPDHYTTPAEPKLSPKATQSGRALLAALGLPSTTHSAVQGTLKRRI